MRVRLTSAAETELVDALDWYEAHASRETGRFLAEFEVLKRRLAENPRQFAAVEGRARRAGFGRYPYGLFFVIGADEVEVFACLHNSRDPRRWQERR
jgi:plasmid stabilization system protein ParE